MIHRAIHRSACFLILAFLFQGCSDDVGSSTDGNTSFFRGCGGDEDCGAGLSCLCGVCTRACAGGEECNTLGECVTPEAASLPCATPERLCAPPSCTGDGTCSAGETCVMGRCLSASSNGGSTGSGGASAGSGGSLGGMGGGSGGAAVAGAGGEGASGATAGSGGAGSAGASQSGGATGSAGRDGGAAGGADAGGADAEATDAGAADADACPGLPVLDGGMACSLALCSTENGGWEVRLSTTEPMGWYVGALIWVMDICGDRFMRSRFPSGDTKTLAYPFTREEFNALDRDAEIYAFYGTADPGPSGATPCGTLNSILSLPSPIGQCLD